MQRSGSHRVKAVCLSLLDFGRFFFWRSQQQCRATKGGPSIMSRKTKRPSTVQAAIAASLEIAQEHAAIIAANTTAPYNASVPVAVLTAVSA